MSSGAPGALPEHFSRIAAALHPLHGVPTDIGWNRDEVADLLPPDAIQVEAAVLVGLVPRGDGLNVLLTRRTDSLRNHAGQVSFPGGRIEATDPDAASAALREAGEEIGLLPSQALPLGFLDPLVTITGFRVLPLVAGIATDYVAVPDPREVDTVFEVSLEYLLNPTNLGHHVIQYRGRERRVLEYRYPGQRIWGATASMLLNFRQRLEAIA